MENHGICTKRGDLNREIEATNQRWRQLKARISKLQNWLKEEQADTERKTLNQRYLAPKEEVREAEQIRKSVYSILRQEQAQCRTQDMER